MGLEELRREQANLNTGSDLWKYAEELAIEMEKAKAAAADDSSQKVVDMEVEPESEADFKKLSAALGQAGRLLGKLQQKLAEASTKSAAAEAALQECKVEEESLAQQVEQQVAEHAKVSSIHNQAVQARKEARAEAAAKTAMGGNSGVAGAGATPVPSPAQQSTPPPPPIQCPDVLQRAQMEKWQAEVNSLTSKVAKGGEEGAAELKAKNQETKEAYDAEHLKWVACYEAMLAQKAKCQSMLGAARPAPPPPPPEGGATGATGASSPQQSS